MRMLALSSKVPEPISLTLPPSLEFRLSLIPYAQYGRLPLNGCPIPRRCFKKRARVWAPLEVESWDFIGIWNLGFGISHSRRYQLRRNPTATSPSRPHPANLLGTTLHFHHPPDHRRPDRAYLRALVPTPPQSAHHHPSGNPGSSGSGSASRQTRRWHRLEPRLANPPSLSRRCLRFTPRRNDHDRILRHSHFQHSNRPPTLRPAHRIPTAVRRIQVFSGRTTSSSRCCGPRTCIYSTSPNPPRPASAACGGSTE
jgi:hypothetical protein